MFAAVFAGKNSQANGWYCKTPCLSKFMSQPQSIPLHRICGMYERCPVEYEIVLIPRTIVTSTSRMLIPQRIPQRIPVDGHVHGLMCVTGAVMCHIPQVMRRECCLPTPYKTSLGQFLTLQMTHYKGQDCKQSSMLTQNGCTLFYSIVPTQTSIYSKCFMNDLSSSSNQMTVVP